MNKEYILRVKKLSTGFFSLNFCHESNDTLSENECLALKRVRSRKERTKRKNVLTCSRIVSTTDLNIY